MLNVLFVLYHDFSTNSAIHVHYFAENLIKLGLDCVVAVPSDQHTISKLGHHLYKTTEFSEIDNLSTLFYNQKPPDIVHGWTPREVVRNYCQKLKEIYEFKLFIHLEDNEECLLEKFLKKPIKELLNEEELIVPYGLSHPQKYRDFLAQADGVTVIIEQLKKFVPSQIPTLTLWPGVDTERFFPKKAEPIAGLDLPENSVVICYTGNVHPANADEVRSLYLAVAMMNRQGLPAVLVRTGRDSYNFLGEDDQWARKYSRELGFVDWKQIPNILALADVLIQPGQSDEFNNYRFPSKLPEFLAMGKPVILPKTNIGHFMEHLQDALVLAVVDASNICDYVKLVVKDRELYHKLSEGAVKFANTYLDWYKNTKALKSFYENILTNNHPTTVLSTNPQPLTKQKLDENSQFIYTQLELELELERIQILLQQTQVEFEKKYFHLQTTQIELQHTQTELQHTRTELEHTQTELEHSKTEIAAIYTSKFWKLRTLWFQFKKTIIIFASDKKI